MFTFVMLELVGKLIYCKKNVSIHKRRCQLSCHMRGSRNFCQRGSKFDFFIVIIII